jgi:hypothetical protein
MMFSSFDKSVVALVMAGIGLANVFGLHWGISQDTVTTIVTVLTPLLVYVVPNLPKDA